MAEDQSVSGGLGNGSADYGSVEYGDVVDVVGIPGACIAALNEGNGSDRHSDAVSDQSGLVISDEMRTVNPDRSQARCDNHFIFAREKANVINRVIKDDIESHNLVHRAKRLAGSPNCPVARLDASQMHPVGVRDKSGVIVKSELTTGCCCDPLESLRRHDRFKDVCKTPEEAAGRLKPRETFRGGAWPPGGFQQVKLRGIFGGGVCGLVGWRLGLVLWGEGLKFSLFPGVCVTRGL